MKVEDYGDMLGQVKGKKCLDFILFGDYQGEWVAILDGKEQVELWKGYYGSCSGCDWLEDKGDINWEEERDVSVYTVTDKQAQEYFREERPFVLIPKATIKDLTLEGFKEIFPANIRKEIDDFREKEMFEALKSCIGSE